MGGCGRGAYAYAKGHIGCLDAPEAVEDDHTTGYDSDKESDDGDLDAAIFSAARSLHEQVIPEGIAATVAAKSSIQSHLRSDTDTKASGLLGIQDAVEKEADFWANLWGVGKEHELDDL